MERVLKRVGLAKRDHSESKAQEQSTAEDKNRTRRRRRSKSRRRSGQENKKTRGLFNIDWESVKDCKSCKSRVITRRFCNKKSDNELYRSNSFKFERFIRGSEEASTLGKKVGFTGKSDRWTQTHTALPLFLIIYTKSGYMVTKNTSTFIPFCSL